MGTDPRWAHVCSIGETCAHGIAASGDAVGVPSPERIPGPTWRGCMTVRTRILVASPHPRRRQGWP
eukprot:scaffold2325_cov105-Isochrysis_galbana.AAC.4